MANDGFDSERRGSSEVSDVLSRLMRSVPVLGFAAHWFQRAERLRIADEEDAAYKATMEALDGEPHFAGATRARETQIIIGQLIGYVAATVLGVITALLAGVQWQILLPSMWGVAVLFDAATAHLSASAHDRKARARYERITEGRAQGDVRTEEVGRDP